MTRIDHAAVWVADLEAARDFYTTWFGGVAGELYHNPRTGLSTYILTFGTGARLELMTRPDVTVPGAGDALARRAREVGVQVVDGPRRTGDGYYEVALLDPEGNRVEVVAGDYAPAS